MATKSKFKAVKVVSGSKKKVVARKGPRKAVPRKSIRPLPVDVGRIRGHLSYGVSERHLHPEIERHRANEKRADGLQVLKAMEGV